MTLGIIGTPEHTTDAARVRILDGFQRAPEGRSLKETYFFDSLSAGISSVNGISPRIILLPAPTSFK
jgi:hypothetical protein